MHGLYKEEGQYAGIDPYADKEVQRTHERRICPSDQNFFSSFGFNAPIIREKFAQVIPDGEALADKKCIVIPYAGYNLKNTAEREKQGLTEFGFKEENIHIVDENGILGYEFPDYIYVPGGDPFKLLGLAKKAHLLEGVKDCVVNKRAVYIGVSAGASLATPDIGYVKFLEDNNFLKDDFGALGLVPGSILCHYDHYSYGTLKTCEEFGKRPCMTIRDDELLMYENGEWRYIE